MHWPSIIYNFLVFKVIKLNDHLVYKSKINPHVTLIEIMDIR